MKKILVLMLGIMMLFSLLSCSGSHYVSSYKASLLVKSQKADFASMQFLSLDGKMVFNLKGAENTVLDCSLELGEGKATVYYDVDGTKSELCSIVGGKTLHTSVPLKKSGKVYVIVETDGKCSDGDFGFRIGK